MIERIAADDRVNGTELLANSQSQTSKAQMLYQHFRHKEAANYSESRVFNRFELWVRAKWQTVVRDCLYRDVPEDVSSLKARNKYLTAFVPLILTGDSPPFFKVGRRVLYDRAELEAWLSLRKRRSTSDHGSST